MDAEAQRRDPENPTPVWQRYWLLPQVATQQEMAVWKGNLQPVEPKPLAEGGFRQVRIRVI